jgi:hypothetical protein
MAKLTSAPGGNQRAGHMPCGGARAQRFVALLGAAAVSLLSAAPATASSWGPAAPLPGSAATYRVFASVGGGIGEHALDCFDRQDCGRSTTASRATLAVALLPGLALEGVVLDFGRSEWHRPGLRVKEQPRLIGLGLMAPLDVAPRLGAELRGGIAQVQNRRQRITIDIQSERKTSNPQWYLGAALVLHLAPNAGLHFAVDASLAEFEQGTARVSASTVGLSLRF